MSRYDDVPGAPIDHDSPLFFYGQSRAYGAFSQWARSTFVVSKARIAAVTALPDDDAGSGIEIEGGSSGRSDLLTFGCAEQFMMFCKAVRFGDRASQRQILATADPAMQKKLGQRVQGFSEAAWDAVKSAVVALGSEAKFGQSAKLRRLLLSTGDRLLVEAAPRDRIWGVGYSADTALANRDTWGENRLGWALMQARATLRAAEGAAEGAAGAAGGGGTGGTPATEERARRGKRARKAVVPGER